MPKLNLEAKNETQKIIKDYLEKNVSDVLADKINNGVRIHKDGKTLINKKTLEECMEFAIKEAQKLTEKGARAACIQDSVVFGWAIHFFEEDSIEGTLYNEDGTEYKPPKPVTPPKTATAYTPPKPQPKPQMSLFELMESNATEEKPSENTQDVSQKTVQPDNPNRDDEEPCDDAETDEEPTKEELQEAAETERDLPLPATPEKAKAVQMQGSPFYQRYMRIQDKYPHCIVLFSRGDFYEALGKGAQILSENLALTLTGRDCGLLERVPMVGIPCHAVDNYIGKALECGLKIVLADSADSVKVYPQQTAVPKPAKAEEAPVRDDPPAGHGKHWIDEKTYVDDDGLVHNVEEPEEDDDPAFDMSAYDAEALARLDEIFGNVLELR
mgnify:CR=1 FL=1